MSLKYEPASEPLHISAKYLHDPLEVVDVAHLVFEAHRLLYHSA